MAGGNIEVKELDVMSVAKILGIMYLVIAGIVGLFTGLFTMAVNVGLGFAILILTPICGGIAGFICGAICAFLYNVFAAMVGGIKFRY